LNTPRKLKAINNPEAFLSLLDEALELSGRHPKETANISCAFVSMAEAQGYISREKERV